MNCKHLRKISVAHVNILKRNLGKNSDLPRHHGYDHYSIPRRTPNATSSTVQSYQSKSLSSFGVWRVCKSPNFEFYQRRNYSSLMEKIKKFLMSVFNSKSTPLLKSSEQVEANKIEATKSSSTVTPSKSDPSSQITSSSPKIQEPNASTPKPKVPEDLGSTQKPDAVAESLMRDTAQKLDVENKRKLPLGGSSAFAEDRLSVEMPTKRRQKLKIEDELKKERIEEAKEAEMYKTIDEAKSKSTKKELEATKFCDYDDVFCGVEQFDDVRKGKTQDVSETKTKSTQVFTAKGEIKPTGLVPKNKQMSGGKGQEKKYSTSAIYFETNRPRESLILFEEGQSNKTCLDFSARLSKTEIFNCLLQPGISSKGNHFWLIAPECSELLSHEGKNMNSINRISMIIRKDPLEIVEQKEPKPPIEVKEPKITSCNLIEPVDKEAFADPILGVPLIVKEEEICFGKEPKEGKRKKNEENEISSPKTTTHSKDAKEGEGEIAKDDKRGKREEKESCLSKDAKEGKRKKECGDKQEISEKGETSPAKAICEEKQSHVVIEEPCAKKKPLCCYNPPKNPLKTDATAKYDPKCAVAPQELPPVMDCSICRKYETLIDDVPKAKPMVCKVRKCEKRPPSNAPKNMKPPSKRSDLCPGPCSKSESEKPKAKAKLTYRTTSTCIKQHCAQQKCPKKGKPEKIVCPSMPKACASKPQEKPTKECKKKTCPVINTASKMEDAKKKEKEIDKKKEREKKCSTKKKKCEVDMCKTLSDCEKKKIKVEEDKKKAEEEVASKQKTIDPRLHTEWKAVPIKGSERWCNDERKNALTLRIVKPNTEKKYQSPRYENKSGCGSKPCIIKSVPKGPKKCIPIGVFDSSQSLAIIENSLYLSNESDDGNDGGRKRNSPKVPPPASIEKSKSANNIS